MRGPGTRAHEGRQTEFQNAEALLYADVEFLLQGVQARHSDEIDTAQNTCVRVRTVPGVPCAAP